MKLRMRAMAVVATVVSIAGFTAMSATAASASVSPTAQLVFDDYLAKVNSIQIIGTNQNGVKEYACWTTPLTVNLIPNWWWSGDTVVWPYTSSNCSEGTQLGSSPLTLTDSLTDPPYHCLEDVSPFSDWNPGSNWQNCQIPSKTPFYGDATGSLVWSHT